MSIEQMSKEKIEEIFKKFKRGFSREHLIKEYGLTESEFNYIIAEKTVFIFCEEVKDEKRKQVFDHPSGGKVTFQKYAGQSFVNVGEYLKPLNRELTEKIKYAIPEKWQDDLNKVWMDVEKFNKLCDNLKKQEKVNDRRKNNGKNTKRSRRKNSNRKIRNN